VTSLRLGSCHSRRRSARSISRTDSGRTAWNPTTNLRFDLPEQARVRVEVVDVVGRTVMTLAPQTMSAGANKVISLDASRLSSGAYFYRVIAEGAERTYVQGSKFTLLK